MQVTRIKLVRRKGYQFMMDHSYLSPNRDPLMGPCLNWIAWTREITHNWAIEGPIHRNPIAEAVWSMPSVDLYHTWRMRHPLHLFGILTIGRIKAAEHGKGHLEDWHHVCNMKALTSRGNNRAGKLCFNFLLLYTRGLGCGMRGGIEKTGVVETRNKTRTTIGPEV